MYIIDDLLFLLSIIIIIIIFLYLSLFFAYRLVSWSSCLKTALSDIEVDAETIEKPTTVRIPGLFIFNFI